MKKILLLFVYATSSAISFSQQSVTIHGPYEPKGKYTSEVVQNMDILMKITGDSALLSEMEKSATPNQMTMSNRTDTKMLVTTGKINSNGTFGINTESNSIIRSEMMGKKDSTKQALFLYGFAKSDEAPHYDSIRSIPESVLSDSAKAAIVKLFQNIGGIQFPQKEFSIGDTAFISKTMTIPVSMVNENIIVTQIYKLIKIENGFADFDISVIMNFGISGKDTLSIQGKGTGGGSGKCVYDIQKRYFKSMNLQMDFEAPVAMDIQGTHLEMDVTGKLNMGMNTSYQPND
ncbi:MAG: hypothetical protein LBE82_13640 [Chitinophagaceae bacterium]|jgi:hypothetical protein|nr:hypothetical protein [Chitinophagaceae bacterium]